MEAKKKNNKAIIIWIIVGIVITFLFFTTIAVLIIKSYLNYQKENSKQPSVEMGEVVRKEEKESTLDDLYTITCKQKKPKVYSGYVIGDTIECTIRYNVNIKNFNDEDKELSEIVMNVYPSNSLSLKKVSVTGPYNTTLRGDFKTTILNNEITIKNENKYGDYNGNYCDYKNYACQSYYSSSGSAKIAAYDYEYNYDSIKGLEVHLELEVLSNLSTTNNIKIGINDISTKVYHFEDYSIQPYKTDIEYSYDIKNNDEYYAENKTIYKLESYNNYKEVAKITCIEKNCDISYKNTLKLGYAVIVESDGGQFSRYIRIIDYRNNEEYKKYKGFHTFDDGEVTYIMGSQESDLNTYTITRLNDKQEVKTITVPDASQINNIRLIENKIVISLRDGKTLEYEL